MNQCLNEKNITVIVGDLGACANLVKNVLSLSPEVDFPNHVESRLDYIKNLVYPDYLKNNLNQWIKHEYQLRRWKEYYDVCIADQYADIGTTKVIQTSQHSRIIFITHWADIANALKQKYPDIQLVVLYPKNDQELKWQISTYISKIGIEKLHNFTFLHDIIRQKNNYIAEFGLDSYYQCNVLNMFEIMKERVNSFKKLPAHMITIGQLQTNNWILELLDFLNLKLNVDQAIELFVTWKNLHPPYNQINPLLENLSNETN
jgi:uncharacterized phage-like protein YoqJ